MSDYPALDAWESAPAEKTPAAPKGGSYSALDSWDEGNSAGAEKSVATEEPSFLSRLAQPFIDIGKGVKRANDFATHTLFHPVDTARQVATNPGASFREGMRGVNSNIPFANQAVEAVGGPAAESPEDTKAAPAGLRDFSSLAASGGVGKMAGGIAAKGVEAAVPLVKGVGNAALERLVGRAKEGLELKTNKRARAGVGSDVVDTALRENPELRKAVGDDVRLATEARAAKVKASAELSKIYDAVPPTKLPPLRGVEQPTVPNKYRPEANEFDMIDGNHGTVGGATVAEKAPAAKVESPPAAPAAAPVVPAKAGPAHLGIDLPLNNLDDRIAELRMGTPNDGAIADRLQVIRDKFENQYAPRETVSAKDLRAAQSDYQKNSYGAALDPEAKLTTSANAEASKALGDAVVQHVTGMPYAEAKVFAAKNPLSTAGKLFKANDTITAANRIEATIADRASKPKTPAGLGAAIKRVAGHALIPTVVGASHGPGAGLVAGLVQEGMYAAPGVARGLGRAADTAMAKFARTGASRSPGFAAVVMDAVKRGVPLATAVKAAQGAGEE